MCGIPREAVQTRSAGSMSPMQNSSQGSRLTLGALVLKVTSVLKVRPDTTSHAGLGSGTTGGEGQNQTGLCGGML